MFLSRYSHYNEPVEKVIFIKIAFSFFSVKYNF
jgi:hypothetical protein